MFPVLAPLDLPPTPAQAKMQVQVQAQEMGPSVPGASNVPRTTTLAYWESFGIQAVLKDMPGAVVVVEDTMPSMLDHMPVSRNLFGGRVRVILGEGTYPGPGAGFAPVPEWADPNMVINGGNIVQRIYALGVGRF